MAVVFTVLMVMAGIYALFKWPIPTLAVLGVLIVIGKSGENKNGGTAPTTAPPPAKPKEPSSPIKPQAQPTAAVRRCEGRDYEARLLRARTESFKIITMQGEAKAAADILSKASGNVYHVTMTSCECEDFKKGHTPCKHMIYFALHTGRYAQMERPIPRYGYSRTNREGKTVPIYWDYASQPTGVCSTNDTGKMTVANDSHWRFTDKVVSNLVELVKYLMAEYGIDAAHVIRHYDVNGKPCPGIIGWNEDTGSAAKWAAFKARLGTATHGGQTGGSTNTGTATGNTALTYKVGDIVQFAGGKHYANSQATSGTTVKPGQAKVTAVAPAGKHPYHIVHTDSASTVYGWVDAAAITGKASATPAAKTYTVKAGDSLWRIAAQQLGNGARYKEIKTMNGLKNNTIHAGQVLKLPN